MRPSRHLCMRLLGCAAVAAVATWFCPSSAALDRPNLLLVSVDTLRADYLGTYGFDADISPNIDALADRGVVFADMLSVIGKTGPSFASLFSSLYPPTHGARRNGVRMRDDVPVLAEILKAQGYESAAFISNWTLKSRLAGVHRGFDHYDEEFNRVRNAAGLKERDARDVTGDTLKWLRQRESRSPIFLWVHYSDPHSPYELQPDHTLPEPEPVQRSHGWRKRWRYASEVAYADSWIGRLLAGVDDHLPASETYVVFVSDHGESLGEHNYWGHGKNTHWPNLRIPWILAGPDIPAGRRVSAPASLVDVLPTVLELLRVESPKGAAGRSRVASWQSSGTSQRPRFAIGERPTAITKKGKSRYQHPVAISAQTKDLKAIYDFSSRSLHYYDLRKDALEVSPLDSSPIEMRPPLGRQLSTWYRDLPKYEQNRGELSEEDVQQLKSLGYL